MNRLALMIACGALAGCATTGEQTDRKAASEPPFTGKPACFYKRQVSDFRVLDRRNLIIYAPSRKTAYRVQISPPSFELRFADAIAFRSRNYRICGYAGDRLLVDRCDRRFSITRVHRLNATELEELLTAYEDAPEDAPADQEGEKVKAGQCTDNGEDKQNE